MSLAISRPLSSRRLCIFRVPTPGLRNYRHALQENSPMSQSRNSGRNATLDQRKARAAGRQKQTSPEREAIRDWQRPVTMKGKTGGAGGRDGQANRAKGRGSFTRGGGG